jgi:DNA modification methylase
VDHQIIPDDALRGLSTLEAGWFHSCSNSPPYFWQRKYGDRPDEIGWEATREEYVEKLTKVYSGVKRVLHPTGSLYVVINDSYDRKGNLLGIPQLLAQALVEKGYRWRETIIWAKSQVDDDDGLEGGGLPGSQRDRCTAAYESILHFDLGRGSYFDVDGVQTTSGATMRNFWRVNTQSNREAHFALMPDEIARRLIRLSTSDRGCCPACGAPWRREVDKERILTRPGTNSKINRASAHEDSPHHDHGGIVIGNRDKHRHTTVTTTVGWKPSCQCGVAETVPCRVLDPFGGAGGTLVAAAALGRHGTMVELYSKYCEIARRRLATPQPPSRRRKALLISDGLRDVLAGRIRHGRVSMYELERRSRVSRAVIQRFVVNGKDICLATADRLCRTLDLILVPRRRVRDRLNGRAGQPPCPTEEEEG